MKRFLGNCIGVTLSDRGYKDPHQCFSIMVEDDENWHPKMEVSSAWLDEAIEQLTAARDYLEKNCERDQCGWRKKS